MAQQTTGDQDDVALPINCTAVGIDKDKNSQNAVKWAIDHLLTAEPLFLVLIHVRSRCSHSHNRSSDTDLQQLFTPYRGYCARKSVQLKEVVLDDSDISKALLDYISSNFISNFVLGSSSRSFIKNFKKLDVPTNVLRSAPEFCSVYVVQKGKLLSSKTAQRPIINTVAPPKLPHALPHQHSFGNAESPSRVLAVQGTLNSLGSDKHLLDKSSDSSRRRQYGSMISRYSTAPAAAMVDICETPTKPRMSSTRSSNSLSEGDDDSEDNMSGFRSIDWASDNLDFSMPDARKGCHSPHDVEAEMRKLRLELKQTLDLYNNACKEAISAKHKAKELGDRKTEEGRKLEQARMAEEAAIAMAEKEKEKCRMAMDAAEAAQRLAQMEAEKRKLAEMKAKRESDDKDRALASLAQQDIRYRKYTIEEIEVATSRFAASHKVGEGGYGPVFKGMLDHTPVAIKVLRPDAAQGRKQFQQEVEVLSCMRHPHMVLLLGACPEYGCLVYEYMNNGSLEDRLFRRGNTPPIPWQIRFKIATEIVTALCFLHHAKPEPLVHRDLKPANILLDRNFVSKISDVGLARLVPPSIADSVTQCHMTAAAGTFYYIDPEYQQSGVLTTKSDVYSLGIMLLQIVTGRPPMGLSHQVERAIEKGCFEEMLDPMVHDWPVEEAFRFAQMALKCCELRKKDRPDLAKELLPELFKLRDFAMADGRDPGMYMGMHDGGSWQSSSMGSSRSPFHSLDSTKPNSMRISRSSDEGGRSSEDGSYC